MNPVPQPARSAAACDVCKRRKEKCNGLCPCARCVKRKVEWQCHFSQRHSNTQSSRLRTAAQISEHTNIVANEDIVIDDADSPMQKERTVELAPVHRLSRLVRHPSRKLIFLGDHANSSFLHGVRRAIQRRVRHCDLVNDPSRNRLVDVMDSGTGDWIKTCDTDLEPKPEHKEGQQFLRNFLWATDGVLDILCKEEVETFFAQWLQEAPNAGDSISAKYYLVLALGAQSDLTASVNSADTYFKTGRYLSMIHFMDKPSLAGVQCFVLITMFLITVSRRNAAAMNLGIAVQAAHAIGLHQVEASKLFTSDECKAREGTWKSIRCLDVLLSGSLGRPLATAETRSVLDVSTSAMVHLCWMAEFIIAKVYLPKLVPIAVVEDISKLHRDWTCLLSERSRTPNVYSNMVGTAENLDIGTLHLNTGYHVSIILLTRPFLLHMAVQDSVQGEAMDSSIQIEPQNIPSEKAFGIACVDSATKIIEFARQLLRSESIPRHLPFVVNAIFLAGLCLGLAFFANLRQQFPLYECLEDGLSILKLFTAHDVVAQRCLYLLNDLKAACRSYTASRDLEKYESRKRLVANLFGNLGPSGLDAPESLSLQNESKRQRVESLDNQHVNRLVGETMTEGNHIARDITPPSPIISSDPHSRAAPILKDTNTQDPRHAPSQIMLHDFVNEANGYLHQSSHWFDSMENHGISFNDEFWSGDNIFSLD